MHHAHSVREEPCSERTLTKAAAAVGISTAGVTGHIDALTKRGLLIRARAKIDRRQVVLQVTPDGVALLEEIMAPEEEEEGG